MALGISQKVARLLLARPTHSVGGGARQTSDNGRWRLSSSSVTLAYAT